jgi:pimeloyl-ACP methyl ester carboxylesterase
MSSQHIVLRTKKMLAVAASLAAIVLTAAAPAPTTAGDCRIGAYRLTDGSIVDIGASTGNALRWRRFDGTTGALHPEPNGNWTSTLGWTDRPDGKTVSFSACDRGDIVFDGAAGHRVAFDVTDTTFTSNGTTLAGRLVLPKGDTPVPVVVLIHGSENYSGRDFYTLQRLFPAEGVGVFVYDKRGTGHSGGEYTQDFDVLANDAAAAVKEARRMAGPRAARVGFQGGSQGGYVAPLAASKTSVDFVIASFGLLVNPLEEDREEIVLQMKLKHHSDAEIAHALEIADAAGVIMESGLTKGFEHFDTLRAKYRNAPWYKDLDGNFTGTLLPLTKAQIQAKAKELNPGTSWRYDGVDVVGKLDIPQLWILGGRDLDAPSAETRRRLTALQNAGRPIAIAFFPNAQHGIYEFETKPDGERVNTRNADGYDALMRDFVREKVRGPYGDSVLTLPKTTPPKG